jgi:DHA1 family tetracycline resistance protein-like MFS transporter
MLLMPNLFGWFTGPAAPVYFPGAAFLAASLCELGGLLLFALAMKPARELS